MDIEHMDSCGIDCVLCFDFFANFKFSCITKCSLFAPVDPVQCLPRRIW
jgi:hypothetical protein